MWHAASNAPFAMCTIGARRARATWGGARRRASLPTRSRGRSGESTNEWAAGSRALSGRVLIHSAGPTRVDPPEIMRRSEAPRDQLTAQLDRGWDLAQQGDARGAEASARQALEIDANAPEVHNLLGYIAALAG